VGSGTNRPPAPAEPAESALTSTEVERQLTGIGQQLEEPVTVNRQ
jgi:hypothetical protein